MADRDFYEILGVQKNASKDEIKKADNQNTPQFEISENINIKISDIDQIMSDLSDLNWIISGKLDCINFGLKDFSFSPSELLFFNLFTS